MSEENPPAEETPKVHRGLEVQKIEVPIWVGFSQEEANAPTPMLGLPMTVTNLGDVTLAMSPTLATVLMEYLEVMLEPQENDVLNSRLKALVDSVDTDLLGALVGLPAGRTERYKARMTVVGYGNTGDEVEAHALAQVQPYFPGRTLRIAEGSFKVTDSLDKREHNALLSGYLTVEVVE